MSNQSGDKSKKQNKDGSLTPVGGNKREFVFPSHIPEKKPPSKEERLFTLNSSQIVPQNEFVSVIDADTEIYITANLDKMSRQLFAVHYGLGTSNFPNNLLFRQKFIGDMNRLILNYPFARSMGADAYEDLTRLYREYYIESMKLDTYNDMVEMAIGGDLVIEESLNKRYGSTLANQKQIITEIENSITANKIRSMSDVPDEQLVQIHTELLLQIKNEIDARKMDHLQNEIDKLGGL